MSRANGLVIHYTSNDNVVDEGDVSLSAVPEIIADCAACSGRRWLRVEHVRIRHNAYFSCKRTILRSTAGSVHSDPKRSKGMRATVQGRGRDVYE
jgi:hypothetical protein